MLLEKTNSTSVRPNGSLAKSGESRAALGDERRDRLGGRSWQGGLRAGPGRGVLMVPALQLFQVSCSGLFTVASSGEGGLQAPPAPQLLPSRLWTWPAGRFEGHRLLQESHRVLTLRLSPL